jgi:hypothetical protein
MQDVGSRGQEAARTYSEVERLRADTSIEIVLVGADSIATIRQTHGHYFNNSAADPFAELIGSHCSIDRGPHSGPLDLGNATGHPVLLVLSSGRGVGNRVLALIPRAVVHHAQPVALEQERGHPACVALRV